MKLFFGIVGGIIGFFVLIFLVGFMAEGQDFILYKYFAPKREQVRYDTFKNSQAYNEGMAQEIRNYQIEYIKGNKEQKQMLRSAVLHMVASYPMEKFPSDLQEFVQKLRSDEAVGN